MDRGVIARLWNLTDKPRTVRVALSGGLSAAGQTTHIETDLAPLPVTEDAAEVTMGRKQIQTIRLTGPTTKPM